MVQQGAASSCRSRRWYPAYFLQSPGVLRHSRELFPELTPERGHRGLVLARLVMKPSSRLFTRLHFGETPGAFIVKSLAISRKRRVVRVAFGLERRAMLRARLGE